MHITSIPRPLSFPIVLDKVTLPMTWGTSHGAEANSAAVNGENADALALVPFRPSLHAVLLTIWAAAQPEFPSCEADAQPATLIIDFSSSQDQHVPTD